jgi:hypothetical protein
MLRLLTLTGLIFVLVACASGGAQTRKAPTASPPAPTPTHSIPAGTLLFQSDWSKDLNSWGNPTGWTVVQGAVQSDNTSNDALTIPYTPSLPNYALEVRFQVISVPANGGEFLIQALPAKNRDGYEASILNLLGSAPHSERDNRCGKRN